MKKVEKVLFVASIAVGVADFFMARSVYLKKKGIVMRDMAIQSLDRKVHKPIDEDAETSEITIE